MKRYISATLIALCLSLGIGSVASAEIYTRPEAKVQVWFPDGWKKQSEDTTTIVSPKDESLVLVFMVVDGAELQKALEKLDAELNKMVKEIQPKGEPKEIKINGMPAIVADATGSYEGKSVELGAAVIITPANKALVIIGVAEKGKAEAHMETLKKVFQSVKPVK